MQLRASAAQLKPCASTPPVDFAVQESELTPTGSNLLDGRYAVFGYVVENEALLQVLN